MNKKTIALGLLLLAACTALYIRFGAIPEPLDENTLSAQMLKAGPFAVASEDLILVDKSRPIPAHENFDGAAQRTLHARIWWPENALTEPRPLVIYNHGFMSTLDGGKHIVEFLATQGYISAAMDFPLTTMYAKGGPYLRDVAHQPGDVKFLLDQLLKRNKMEGDILFNAIDEQRIAVMGLSLGGMTTTMVSFHPAYFDPRIKAAISFGGPGSMFSSTFFEHRDLPYMMVASEIDAMVSYEGNASNVLGQIKNSTLVNIKNGSHAGFDYNSRGLRFLSNPDSLGCVVLTHFIGDVVQDENWLDDIGTEEQGIVFPEGHLPCTAETLPPAMNVLRQQELQILATWSFLESIFAQNETDRLEHETFLYQKMPSEHSNVVVSGTPYSQRGLEI